ncbi:cysteine hydrolase family protein [Paenibacillus sp. ATY16]|uniref:cysteine hydrolase family protein n=1 Tax=Paenibacillus sp. ATY16 TaxID=1759312 RepID=UPI0020102D5E|nr:cysteine hydrolase family protein [Paenibacillus sp. ATY16]MCK9861075.1 cysteine hydrolase [Paenibacillus sp. ATY16]
MLVSKDTALMVIDVQNGMFLEEYPIHEEERLLNRINLLLAKARESQIPVIYVQHNEELGTPLETHSPGWEIHSAVAPAAQDLIIQKYVPDSFHETNLQEELTTRGINKLVLSGLQTDCCIDATSRRAVELGYDVTVVKDAHSTCGQGSRTAAQIVDEYNQSFAERVNLIEASEIEFN